jgi:hypothetical protein
MTDPTYIDALERMIAAPAADPSDPQIYGVLRALGMLPSQQRAEAQARLKAAPAER